MLPHINEAFQEPKSLVKEPCTSWVNLLPVCQNFISLESPYVKLIYLLTIGRTVMIVCTHRASESRLPSLFLLSSLMDCIGQRAGRPTLTKGSSKKQAWDFSIGNQVLVTQLDVLKLRTRYQSYLFQMRSFQHLHNSFLNHGSCLLKLSVTSLK